MTIWYSPRDEITVKEILQNQYSWWLASDPLQIRIFPGWGSAWKNPLFKSFDHMLESNFEEFSCTFTKVNSVIQLKMHMKNHLELQIFREEVGVIVIKTSISPLLSDSDICVHCKTIRSEDSNQIRSNLLQLGRKGSGLYIVLTIEKHKESFSVC